VRPKRVIQRQRAAEDVDEAAAYYLREGGTNAALGFINAVERAYDRIARHPGAASQRYAHELELHGLRAWPLRRYPYLVFYVERESHIDVWRVLHGKRDIPAWMQETSDS
jgi:toxin ParE1/3/4